jgi:MoaA/NifB/PqqE/SkfB family radical SAM enzyme
MCYHPWVGLDISPQGDFRPCCKYNGTLGLSLEEYENNPDLQKLREDFLNGERPVGCQRCWSDEDSELPSKRTIDNVYFFNNQVPDLKSYKVLSLPFGNTCNLSCRTCDSLASSRWAQEETKLKTQFPDITIYSHKKFYRDEKFLTDIKNISSELISVTFPGGESFITGIPQQLEFLDRLIEKNSKNISLTYITNTTTFPDQKFWDRWEKFKSVDIQLSVDGIGEKFEYIRWPANWNECYNNIKQYQDKIKLFNNIKLSISHTVSIFNVFYLPEFFIWCLKEKLPEPYIGMVSDPGHYNIKVLPEYMKQKLKQKLIGKKFAGIIKFMEENTGDFTETVRWIKAVDLSRNQDFIKTFPELSEYLTYTKDAKCQI